MQTFITRVRGKSLTVKASRLGAVSLAALVMMLQLVFMPATTLFAASSVVSQGQCAGIDEDALNDDDITVREPAWREVEEGYRREIEEWRASEDMSVDELNSKPCHRIVEKYWDHPDPELRGRARDAWRNGEYGPPEIIPDGGSPGYRSFRIEPWMPEGDCNDGRDNDGDGDTDSRDSDCTVREHKADLERSSVDRGGWQPGGDGR